LRLIHGYFIGLRGCHPSASSFEIHHGHEARVADFIERETQCLLYSVFTFAHFEDQLPGSTLRSGFTFRQLGGLEHTPVILAALKWGFQRYLDFGTGEAFEMRGRFQGPIQPWRRNLQAAVVDIDHFQCELKLAGDLFTVFHGDEFARQVVDTIVRAVALNAQQPPWGALDIHQLVTQTRHGAFNSFGQTHLLWTYQFNQQSETNHTHQKMTSEKNGLESSAHLT